jgi:two-component system chemotaxis response regulator CheY
MEARVLIVEDSSAMRLVLKKVLKMAGMEIGRCFEAAHGREALEILDKEGIDVIFTDIHMPVMDGLAFLEDLTRDELLKRIPVILVTTEGRPEIIRKALALGAAAHIRKPFQPETIRRILEKTLGKEYARGMDQALEGRDF